MLISCCLSCVNVRTSCRHPGFLYFSSSSFSFLFWKSHQINKHKKLAHLNRSSFSSCFPFFKAESRKNEKFDLHSPG